jgi:bile acid:Na+ symporter, BASS family
MKSMTTAMIKQLLTNRNFIFFLSIIFGLLFSRPAEWLKPMIMPALALVMTLSTVGISNDIFRSPRDLVLPTLIGTVMSYLILGSAIIGMSALLIRDETLWVGYVLIAAVPPAVAVIPFAHFLKGDISYSLMGTVGAYLSALIIMPLMALGLLKSMPFDLWKLIEIMLELIILPLAASRIILWKGWQKRIEPVRGVIVDWSFFLVLYIITGLNSDILISQPLSIIPVIIIAFASTFLLGSLIEKAGILFRIRKDKITSLVLLGTLKNYGLSGGLALTLFSREASLPSAVCSIFLILFYLWLNFRKRLKGGE